MSGGAVMVARPSDSTNAVFHALESAFGVRAVIVEDAVGGRQMVRGRARRLGWRAALGQVAFRVVAMPALARAGRRRRAEVLAGVETSPIPEDRITRVPSVNDDAAVAALEALAPAVVVVAGTRIISTRVLDRVPATFLNLHAGITPEFRGTHGAYWALHEGFPERCGATVHVVDAGVDTGAVVAQVRIHPTPADSFATYPALQLVAGLPLLVDAVGDALEGRLSPRTVDGPSRQWYHPTLLDYLASRLRRGVR